MPGRGPAPKAQQQNQTLQHRRDEITKVVSADGRVRGPLLPKSMDWPPQTVKWWHNLRLSPMAQTWIPADWDMLLDTALLHARLWSGDLSVAGELRQRMGMFGASPESRLRLRIQVEQEAEKARKAKPRVDSGRRSRLLRAVGE